MARLPCLAFSHRDDARVGVEIGSVHTCQLGVPAAGQQRAADKVPECGLTGIDQPHAFGLGEIADERRLHRLEWLHPPPSVIARDVPGLPCMVQCGFQDGEDTVRGGAALANSIGAGNGLTIVLPPARLGSYAGSLLR